MLDRCLDLLDPLVQRLLLEGATDNLRERVIDLHGFCGAKVLELDVLEVNELIDQRRSSHHGNVLQVLLFDARGPWDVHGAALDYVLLVVVNHSAHRLLLQVLAEKQERPRRLLHYV